MISCGDNKSWWILLMTPLAFAATHTHHHLSLPRSFVNTARPTRPAGCQMELTRSQPALSLLHPAALEGKPSSQAKAASPPLIPLLCHSAGAAAFVPQWGFVCLFLSAGLLLKVTSHSVSSVQTLWFLNKADCLAYCRNYLAVDVLI